jgi:hypothetical protein
MWRRIIYEDWQLIFPVMALVVASAIYLIAGWRASRMPADDADRMERLPLEHD